jgi:hypothetical protein
MTDHDDDDEFNTDDQDGCIPCPHCRSTDDCVHQILFWSEGNEDWIGHFADATRTTAASLRRAVWQALRSKGKGASKHPWPPALSQFIRAAARYGLDPDDPENCDWDGPMREYWSSLWSDCSDCLDYRWTSENGAPGCDDSFGVLFAANPDETTARIKAVADQDIALLAAWATSSGIEPPTHSASESSRLDQGGPSHASD